ncbi:hypothetical protein D3C78_900730 [compost metagenome]
MADRQLLGHPLDGLRQRQAGLDADHQQVQRIGKGRAQRAHACLLALVHINRRHNPAHPRSPYQQQGSLKERSPLEERQNQHGNPNQYQNQQQTSRPVGLGGRGLTVTGVHQQSSGRRIMPVLITGKTLAHLLQHQLQATGRCAADTGMATLEHIQAALHRTLQANHQQPHGHQRQHRTQSHCTDKQQTRQLRVAHHAIEQTQ